MSILGDLWAVRWNRKSFARYLDKKRLPEDFDEKAKKSLSKNFPGRFTDAQIEEMLPDMRKCYRKSMFYPDNYVLFHLATKSERERDRYVSEGFHRLYTSIFNTAQGRAILRSKYQCYQHFRPYYHREMILLKTDEDFDAFAQFTAAHPRFVTKPLGLSCGTGVCLKSLEDAGCPEELFMILRLQYPDGFVIEEPIVQSEDMRRLHPTSVNTIRAVTLKLKNELKIIFMMLRIGQGGSFVDNGSAGGVFCAVDVERGVVTAAADHTHAEISVHPTTGVPLIGFEIPEFDKLKAFICTLADGIEGADFIGWDLAHTDSGWILVEANSSPQMNSIQILTGEGLKPTMQKLCRKYRFGF
ncbi:MAG: hypothetical protein IJS44_00630 [Clostridia bacterium]|nr:hypothetical protein [Clostridia bacterium]